MDLESRESRLNTSYLQKQDLPKDPYVFLEELDFSIPFDRIGRSDAFYNSSFPVSVKLSIEIYENLPVDERLNRPVNELTNQRAHELTADKLITGELTNGLANEVREREIIKDIREMLAIEIMEMAALYRYYENLSFQYNGYLYSGADPNATICFNDSNLSDECPTADDEYPVLDTQEYCAPSLPRDNYHVSELPNLAHRWDRMDSSAHPRYLSDHFGFSGVHIGLSHPCLGSSRTHLGFFSPHLGSSFIHNIVDAARHNLGRPVWAFTKFAAFCHSGYLGCAATVSKLLQEAGVMVGGSPSVAGLVGELGNLGWHKIKIHAKSQFHAGDIVFGLKGSHAHVGIITAVNNGQVYVCDNSSASGTLKERTIEAGGSFTPEGRFAGNLYVMRAM